MLCKVLFQNGNHKDFHLQGYRAPSFLDEKLAPATIEINILITWFQWREEGEGGRGALRKDPFVKQSKSAATEIPFYFLYRCQVLNRHPIYYLVSWLIRVDTNRAEICLTHCSQGFFHTLAQSQTFHKVEGKGKGAVGVLFPVFYHQDEYDLLSHS